jgi:hypothetical protein
MGRYISPDWSEQPQPVPYVDVENPQSLNLYAYGLNNPLTAVDLDGHVPCGGTANVTIVVTPNGSSMSQSPDDCPNGNHPGWLDFPGWAWVGLGNLMLSQTPKQAFNAAGQMAYGYVGDAAAGWAVGTVVQGLGRIVRSFGGKIVVERVMSRAELQATESSGLLRGGRSGTHFVTDDVGTDSSLGAKSRLDLPTEPEFKVTIELDKNAVSGSSPVPGNQFGEVGGGTQRMGTGNVQVKILSVQRLRGYPNQ